MNTRFTLFFSGLLLLVQYSYGQSLKGGAYALLNAPYSAKSAAMGTVMPSNYFDDGAAFVSNPAAALPSFDQHLGIHYTSRFAGIQQGLVTYQFSMPKTGSWAVSAQYLHFGTMQGYDPSGNPEGTFTAGDYLIAITKQHQVGNFSVGLSAKFINSKIESYAASAMLFDAGILFIHPEHEFSAGLVLKNFGFNLRNFDTEPVNLPFDVQLGATFKPDHMPVRFSVAASYLPHNAPYLGQNEQENTTLKDAFRYFNIGTEFLIHKNVHLMAGYNQDIRASLGLQDKKGLSGFAFGGRILVKKWTIDYTYAAYHAAGGAHFVSLSTNLSHFKFRN